MPPALARLLGDSRALATLAVPLALTQLAQVALTTTDTIRMGLLGAGETLGRQVGRHPASNRLACRL